MLALCNCTAADISYNYPDNPDYQRQMRTKGNAKDVVVYGQKNQTK